MWSSCCRNHVETICWMSIHPLLPDTRAMITLPSDFSAVCLLRCVGGNASKQAKQQGTGEEMMYNVRQTAKQLAKLTNKFNLTYAFFARFLLPCFFSLHPLSSSSLCRDVLSLVFFCFSVFAFVSLLLCVYAFVSNHIFDKRVFGTFSRDFFQNFEIFPTAYWFKMNTYLAYSNPN